MLSRGLQFGHAQGLRLVAIQISTAQHLALIPQNYRLGLNMSSFLLPLDYLRLGIQLIFMGLYLEPAGMQMGNLFLAKMLILLPH